MLVERAKRHWIEQGRHRAFTTTLSFESAGLVLGRGTILARSQIDGRGSRRLRLDEEPRLLALLSTAYGRRPAAAALGRIRKAAEKWSEGEDCQAALHLVFARLPRLEKGSDAAWRLFLVDELIASGVDPADVLASIGRDPDAPPILAKLYDENEARVLAGNGRESGRWTRVASFLARLTPAQWLELGRFVGRFAGPVAAAGMLFIPNRGGGRDHDGEIEGTGGLRYAWTEDEAALRITDQTGKLVLLASHGEGGAFYDDRGVVVGRTFHGDVVIDADAVRKELPATADQDEEPKLCPAPGKDKAGRTGEAGDKDKDYEDYVKMLVNPVNPTPRGFGVQLSNPTDGGKMVFYDDCQRQSGILIEAKGTGYAEPILRSPFMAEVFGEAWVEQARRQVAASGGRPIQWHFAEQKAADVAREFFDDNGLKQISVIYTPWTGN